MYRSAIKALVVLITALLLFPGRVAALDPRLLTYGAVRAAVEEVLVNIEGEIPYNHKDATLLMFTAIIESDVGKLLVGNEKTIDSGVFQISPIAEKEVFIWTKKNKPGLYDLIIKMKKGPDPLRHNLKYQIIVARSYYYRWVKGYSPSSVTEMARIWKKFYNTPSGRGSELWAKKKYERYMNEKNSLSTNGTYFPQLHSTKICRRTWQNDILWKLSTHFGLCLRR